MPESDTCHMRRDTKWSGLYGDEAGECRTLLLVLQHIRAGSAGAPNLAAEVLQRYIYDTDGSTSSVCDVTGFCGLDTKQELQSGAAGASLTDATPCDKCRMTVLEFRMVINNPTVQSEIVNVTFTLCDHVAPYQQQCREYVTKYAPVVFDLIRKNFQPDYVCKALLLCQQPSLWKHLPAIGPGNAWNSLLWLFGRDDNQHRQQQR
eukprot:358486-Chlamydomonas_euryale.AAC.13